MMKTKEIRILLVLLMTAFLMPPAWAQTTVTKEAKKQAKTLKKEGWTVNDGEKDLEQQVADFLYYTSNSDYIVESATQKTKAYHLGFRSANEKAKGAIARRLNTIIASATTVSQTNLEGGDGQVESQVALDSRIKSISQETLSGAFPVLVLSRQLPDGTCEVQVHLAIAIPETAE
jgi:hypothetical protein